MSKDRSDSHLACGKPNVLSDFNINLYILEKLVLWFGVVKQKRFTTISSHMFSDGFGYIHLYIQYVVADYPESSGRNVTKINYCDEIFLVY